MAQRPVGIVGHANSIAQSCEIHSSHRAVAVLDFDLTMALAVIAAMDEIAVPRAIRAR